MGRLKLKAGRWKYFTLYIKVSLLSEVAFKNDIHNNSVL